ncbi:MAG: hypothetical protein KC731_16350 [Myxococcales bacterium]|nr:hypothetical protein [Myxococcales bacterium]
MIRYVGLLGIGCFVLQILAYRASPSAGSSMQQCALLPFGECESALGQGYATMLSGTLPPGLGWGVATATFVGLFMYLTLLLSLHAPSLTRRGRPSPVGWLYLALFAGILGYSATKVPGLFGA